MPKRTTAKQQRRQPLLPHLPMKFKAAVAAFLEVKPPIKHPLGAPKRRTSKRKGRG